MLPLGSLSPGGRIPITIAVPELRMRESPSIIPWGVLGRDVYLVLDDFGELGRSWCETVEADTDRPTLIRHLLEGQYSSPIASSLSTPSRAGRAT